MREVIRAKSSGFCFGVKKAIEITEEKLNQKNTNMQGGKLYTWGPLIHNQSVINDLESRGVNILTNLDDANPQDTIIVRSHGETKAFFEEAKEKGYNVVDATCIFVKKIQELVAKGYEENHNILIIGDRDHPEVIGINGWCNNSAVIVNSKEEAEKVSKDDLIVVCQTTIKRQLMDEVVKALKGKGKTLEISNTICNATTERQKATEELAKEADAMIVIGGKNSSNTLKLYEIAQKTCNNSFFIEKIEDLPLKNIQKCNRIGVAAGASTPESVIKEVIAIMSENTLQNEKHAMEDFMAEIDASLRIPRVGEIVNGKVHQVTEKEVIVNMGCKKDGILPKDEVAMEEGQKLSDLFKEDDEVQAKVIKADDGDGGILLSKKKLQVTEHWNEVVEAYENKSTINVKVNRIVNGGVNALYKEVVGFIPLSQLSERFIENAEEYVGQNLDVKVAKVDPRRGRAVFTHKAILAEEKRKQQAAVWETLNEGDIIDGKVMRFTDYGAFIDLGGIDGLLHISEISWGKLKHPKEVLQINDVVTVKILSMNEEKGKISLGLKQTKAEPWSVIGDNYAVGQVVQGKVVQIKEYGAFIELEPGLDGLVHISEVAHKRVTNIADEFALDQEVSAEILEIDSERKRISLSVKATMEAPEVPAEEAVVEAAEVTEE